TGEDETRGRDRGASVFNAERGGGPRLLTGSCFLAQPGNHEDVVVGPDGEHEKVQHDRKLEGYARFAGGALEKVHGGAKGGGDGAAGGGDRWLDPAHPGHLRRGCGVRVELGGRQLPAVRGGQVCLGRVEGALREAALQVLGGTCRLGRGREAGGEVVVGLECQY